MPKQFHFVVQYDTDTREFSLDLDTLYAKFPEGFVFDKDTQEWESAEPDEQEYLNHEDFLSGWLQKINEELNAEDY